MAARLRAFEIDRHQTAMEDCGGDPECLGEAGRTHAAEMQDIAEGLQTCKAGCHDQGEGSGGQ